MKGMCEECGIVADIDKHHNDKNRKNNVEGNVQRLCRWCHRVADGKQSHRPISAEHVRGDYASYFPRA